MTDHQPTGLPRPAVIVSVSPFGDRVAAAVSQRMAARRGSVPAQCQLVDSTEDPQDRIGRALTAALNVRNTTGGPALLDSQTRYRSPFVLGILAAGELDEPRSAAAAHQTRSQGVPPVVALWHRRPASLRGIGRRSARLGWDPDRDQGRRGPRRHARLHRHRRPWPSH